MKSRSPAPSFAPRIYLLVALAIGMAGCAGAREARRMSATAASLTDSYKAETQKFFVAQDEMVNALVDDIASRQELAAALNNQTRVQRGSWEAAKNTAALRIYDSLSAQSVNAILNTNVDLQSLRPITLPASTSIDPKPFEAVTGTLNQMAQPPSLTDQAKFLYSEAKDVSDQYKQSLNQGASSAKSATAETKQQKAPKAPLQ